MAFHWKDNGGVFVMSFFHGNKMGTMKQFLQSKYVRRRKTGPISCSVNSSKRVVEVVDKDFLQTV